MMSDIEVKFIKMLNEIDPDSNPWNGFATYDEVVKRKEKRRRTMMKRRDRILKFKSVAEIEVWAWNELDLGKRIPGDKERDVLSRALVAALELGKDSERMEEEKKND